MIPVSAWYTSLATYTFPTIFLRLTRAQIDALIAGEANGDAVEELVQRLNHAIKLLPGSAFVHADVCAPIDAETFARGCAVKTGRRAWNMLTESERVRQAFADGKTERLGIHPYRRMDSVREFRLFIRQRQLKGVSQKQLDRHYRRLAGRKQFIWNEANRLVDEIAAFLPADELTIDVYLTSQPNLMILDMDSWGAPTRPLLFRSWEHDWDEEGGLRLIPPPIQLKGDVEVSF